MREHKFKVWDKKNEEWIELTGDTFLAFCDGKFEVIDGNEHYATTLDNVEIVKYTGLKDKDGTEIYEGYIVEINNHKYRIHYEIGSFMLVRCSDETDMYEQFENCWNDDVYPLSQFYWENDCEENVIYECKVIGNIFENPELLEVEE